MGGWNLLERLGLKSAPTDGRLNAFWAIASTADGSVTLKSIPSVAALLATSGAERVELVRQCVALFKLPVDDMMVHNAYRLLSELFRALATQPTLPFSPQDLATIALADGRTYWSNPPVQVVLGLVERRYTDEDLPVELVAACRSLAERFSGYGADVRKIRERIERLLKPATERNVFELTRVDAWSNELCDLVAALAEPERQALTELLTAVQHPSGSKPSAKWLKSTGALIEALGRERLNEYLARLLAKVGVDVGVPAWIHAWDGGWTNGDPTLVSPVHAELLKGLIWAAAPGADVSAVQAIGDAAERCFKKVAGVGPRAPKIGNACLVALALTRAPNAVGQLSRLQGRVRHHSSRTQVERALNHVAEQSGVSRDALEDMSVPTCGLTELGGMERKLGDVTAVVRLTGARDFEVSWISAAGKPQKSVPASVKSEHAAALKELKKDLKELEQQLPTQLRRLESMLLSQRSLSLADLRRRFLQHPLVGYLSRRLLWRVADSSQICGLLGDQLVDADDRPREVPETAQVTLWHPLHSSADEVQGWRRWLEKHQITQPFKQAHREVYLLTDAERQTGAYSNRFAAHVLRQHQFSALCRERGWHYALQGGFDSHNTPHVELPAHGFRIEYWVEGVHEEGEMSDAGIFLYVVTDQVRFVRLGELEPMELAQVPPLLFSEMMRDVDLFVGVCSVGNDPNWRDQGQHAAYAGYWQAYAFGELGETAKTRRDALARIVPRLRIAAACSLEERFLVVRGRYRTYRIHLGSANIQMDPNSQYLCIVASRNSSAPGNVMLPFEGDGTLSLILSKALLLVDDHKITDPSIRSQIGLEHYGN
jgi:hypothetical protein